MKLVLALLSLIGGTIGSDEVSAQTSAALNKLNMDQLQKEIMEKVSAELLQKDISKQIENQVEKRVQEELVKQREEEKLYKFKEFTEDDWRMYDKLVLYQKLQNVMKDLSKQGVVDGLWKDVSPEAKNGPLRKFKIDFDLDKQQIGVQTKATDNDGKPLYEWKLDSALGEIQHIKRIPIIDPKAIESTKTTETIDPVQQVKVEQNQQKEIPAPAEFFNPKSTVVTEKVSPKRGPFDVEDPIEPEWTDLEAQRDLAFKVVYFFIMFIIATFGLLYAYFKLDKKEQEQQAREQRAKGAFYGKIDDRTFFDFLAGHVDEENNATRSQAPHIPM